MRQAFFSVACPVLLSLIKCYFVVACRFKRQISVKPQCAGSEAPTKPQYTRICSVFGVKIKYRAVSIYSFSKNTHTTPFCQITALSGVSISQLLFYLLHTLWHNGFFLMFLPKSRLEIIVVNLSKITASTTVTAKLHMINIYL